MEIPNKQARNALEKVALNVIRYSDTEGGLIDKYDEHFYLNFFDWQKINIVNAVVGDRHRMLLDEQFVRLILTIVPHSEMETLFLAMSALRLYRRIAEETANSERITIENFTSYLCDKICEDDDELIVPLKCVPPQSSHPDKSRIRQIDIDPAIVMNRQESLIPKISKEHRKKDKKLEEKKPVSQFIFSSSQQLIIALGRLSPNIYLYGLDLKVKHKIVPSCSRVMEKDLAILSVAYSAKSERIGAIINNIGITFWEAGDNFKTEKTISKSLGSKIYYLEFNDEWITTDNSHVYFWDLKEESLRQVISCPEATLINDICEIVHLRCICIAYTRKNGLKNLSLYHGVKLVGNIDLDTKGCHSLHYNIPSQTMIAAGYQSLVSVYSVEALNFEMNLQSYLKGHSSIVTCVCSVESSDYSGVVATGDDTGEVRLWELNTMRCIQAVRVAKWIGGLKCSGSRLIFSDSRLNIMEMDCIKQIEKDEIRPLAQFYDDQQETIWVITRKDARCVDIHEGRVKRIFILTSRETEVCSATRTAYGFIIGNSKGEIIHYSFEGKKHWSVQAHDSEVLQMGFDQKRHLLYSLGNDGKLNCWMFRAAEEKPLKTISFSSKAVNVFGVLLSLQILVVGSTEDNEVLVWDARLLKLSQCLELDSPPSAISVDDDKNIVAIISSSLTLYLFSCQLKDEKLGLKLTHKSKLTDLQEEIRSAKDLSLPTRPAKNNQLNKPRSEIAATTMTIVSGADTTFADIYVGTVTGSITKIRVSLLKNALPPIKQDGVNRPALECYETERDKNKYVTINLKALPQQNNNLLTCVYTKKTSSTSDPVSAIEFLPFNEPYLCVTAQQGELSLISVQTGAAQGNLRLSEPLPNHWNVNGSCDSLIQDKIVEALSLIDRILVKKGFQLPSKEYNQICVDFFIRKMETFITEKPQRETCFSSPPKVLSEEYSTEDLSGTLAKGMSLKSLEAYKRVKLIRRQNNIVVEALNRSSSLLPSSSLMLEKESYQDLLSSRLPLIQKPKPKADPSTMTSNETLALSMSGILPFNKENQTKPKLSTKMKSSLSLLRQSVMDQAMTQSAASILNELNEKLSKFKRCARRRQSPVAF